MLLSVFDDRAVSLRAKSGTMFGALILANTVAWGWAWAAFGDNPALLGTGLLAYLFGLRHAFDADHIAAIDNVVRKLMQEGKAPCSAGFFFAVGHSTIVAIAAVAVALTATAMQSRIDLVRHLGGSVAGTVSAFFLLTIGLANLMVLKSVWSAFGRARRGEPVADEDLNALLSGGGLLARLFRPLFRMVSRSWHLYPIGFLFGLGFDTATEIGLLGISGAQAAHGMSIWSILVFPALFAAGMALMDTADSMLMTRAYGWAFVDPIRKLWYNLTITAASVIVALFIGGIEALGLAGSRFGLTGRFWAAVGALNENLGSFGIAVVGIFAASWFVSGLLYRARGYDRLEIGPS